MKTLADVKTALEQQFARAGVVAEVTFARRDMFSVFCEPGAGIEKALELMRAAGQKLDSVEYDSELGDCAYYTF